MTECRCGCQSLNRDHPTRRVHAIHHAAFEMEYPDRHIPYPLGPASLAARVGQEHDPAAYSGICTDHPGTMPHGRHVNLRRTA